MSGWRELSDEELYQLDVENNRRMQVLQEKGFAVLGEREHYMLTLLEEGLSERQLAAAREKHALWVCKRLDESEPAAEAQLDQIRQHRLLEGLNIAPDIFGSPGSAR